MSIRRKTESNHKSATAVAAKQSASAPNNQAAATAVPGQVPSNATAMQRISELVSQGNFERAFQLLNAKGEDLESQHAKAVCLMRLGRYTEAIQVFRRLVLNPGCIWMRPDRPLLYKTNFALALLLGGHPAGCTAVLSEIDQDKHPSVIRIRALIRRWEKTLPFWEKFNWRWCAIEPVNRPVIADFAAGDFVEPVNLPNDPSPSNPTPSLKTAA